MYFYIKYNIIVHVKIKIILKYCVYNRSSFDLGIKFNKASIYYCHLLTTSKRKHKINI